jgi:ubiquinone/menaquinone biosynthesis C-methylase UbiE
MEIQAAGAGRFLMSADILQYFSKTRAGFLHAVGEAGTERLLDLVDCKRDENILELGFGTGATLVKIAARNKEINLHGVEKSELMFSAARARIKFCGLEKRIELKHADELQKFPYPDNFFDRIIIESVLAIQEGNDLPRMIAELYRVLKWGGRLFANETLWLASVSDEEISTINQKCKSVFGIIQSNGFYKDQPGWKNLLSNAGLQVQKMEVIDDLKSRSAIIPRNFIEARSEIFTLSGKYKSRMNAALKDEYRSYTKHMDTIYDKRKKYMEGVIIVAQKTDRK